MNEAGKAKRVPEVGGAEKLGLGDGLDEEGEELLQRHLRQALGARCGLRMVGDNDNCIGVVSLLPSSMPSAFAPEARDEEHDDEQVVHKVLGAKGAELEHLRVVHALVVAEGRGREPSRGAHHKRQRLS